MEERHDATHELLEHAAWLRRLARGLVRDASTADELVQRTWIAALERPPLTGSSLRGWLASVLKNFVRQDRRAGDRRVAREHDAARREALPAGDAQLEQLELQRQLMDAVLALSEPYRSVVVQRYYDELAPREIARRTNVPVKTVKTQLARAQQKLREALDREHGSDRNAWLALVVPWISSERVAASTAGGVLVNAKLKLGIGVAIAAGTIAAVVYWSAPNPPHVEGEPAGAHASALLDAPSELAPPVELATANSLRVEVAPPTVEAPPSAAVIEAPKPRVRGRVVDTHGFAVAGIDVCEGLDSTVAPARKRGPALATSDVQGNFEIDTPRLHQRLEAESESFTTVLAPRWNKDESPSLAVVVVAPKIAVHGRVLDERQTPVAGVDLSLTIDHKLRASLGLVLDTAIEVCPQTTSATDGSFEFPVLPVCNARLVLRAAGFELESVAVPERSTFDLVVVLRRPEEQHVMPRGVVLEPDGRPAEGAFVSHGADIRTTEADGTFEFDFEHAIGGEFVEDERGELVPNRDYRWLCALKAGRRPVRVALPSAAELARDAPFFRLVLGEAPLQIRGRVIDADGRPAPDSRVWIKDPTPFGSFVVKEGDMWMASRTTLESALRGQHARSEFAANERGEFMIDGLLEREYELVALDRKTLRSTTRPRVRAGEEGVVLALPGDPPLARVAGRVLSKRNVPIAAVRVHVGRQLLPEQPVNWIRGVETDAEGRFDLGEMVSDDLHFQLSGDTVKLVQDIELPKGAQLSELELRASLQCHVQVDLGERPDFAHAFSTLDENGDAQIMLCWIGSGALAEARFPIEDGRSQVVVVEETSREIVLYARDKEVARVPLTLKAGELTIVRP
ncbi:MAG: sigma-70 family RNA polymerase sigma factor [Planctomycetota bacterium]